ncbi:sulfotransferase family protein [Tsuneonella sp. HG249]
MTLEVIAAGLGRNATLSMKFALEALGLGPCHHMTEVLADGRQQIPLWLAAAEGRPNWGAIFKGFRSTSDYPSATYWRELAAAYPQAKVILTTRDADGWCDSVKETIFHPARRTLFRGMPVGSMLEATIFDPIGHDPEDRTFLKEWYTARNQSVVDALPADRLLPFHPREGWEPLCAFLGVPVPEFPFPHVNSRSEFGTAQGRRGTFAGDPETHERAARQYIEIMRGKAFQRAA